MDSKKTEFLDTSRIPKKIHYCWFGDNPKTELMLKCISSWKNIMPDWEFIEWNNENIKEINSPYLKSAFNAKKWAFASDYVRLWVLQKYGGVYLDVDVEVVKSFDEFLKNDFFIGVEQVTKKPSIGCGVIGSIKNHKIITDMLEIYDNLHFIKPNGRYNLKPIPKRFFDYFSDKYKLKLKNNSDKTIMLEQDVILYPYFYFSPVDKSVKNIHAIHHFADSWQEDWGIRTVINSKRFGLHLFKKHKKMAKELPLLNNEELLFYLKLSNKKSIALVKKEKIKNLTENYSETCPRVSVIIIADNDFERFKLSFNSVIAQFYQNYELIVADISSDDKAKKHTKILPLGKIKYLNLNGMSFKEAEKIGYQSAKGEKIICLYQGKELETRESLEEIINA